MKCPNRSLILSLVLLYGVSSFTPFLNATDTVPLKAVSLSKAMHEKRKVTGSKHIRQVDQKKILVEQKKITFLLRNHKTARLTMQAGAVLVVLYYLYNWFGSRGEDDTAAAPVAAKEGFKDWVKNMPGRAGNALVTWDTYLTVGKWVGQFGAYAVINKVFGDFITATNHSNTISWFTRTRVPFEKTLKELRQYAQLLENKEVAGDELVYTQRALVSTANTLVADVEKLCAFMQYKLKTSDIPVDRKSEVSSLITYVIEQTNVLVNVLEKERTSDKHVFISHIDSFKGKIQREVKRFGRIDEEKDWEEEMRELGTDLNSLIARNDQTSAIKKKTKTPDLVKA